MQAESVSAQGLLAYLVITHSIYMARLLYVMFAKTK